MQEELRIRVIFEGDSVKQEAPKSKKSVDALSGSLNDLRKRLQDAQLAMNNAVKGTRAWEVASKRVAVLQNHLGKSVASSTGQLHSMGTALQAMNFTIRDSPYFFRDFSLGVLAVGNNLNPMIDSLIRVKNEAKAMNSSLTRELLKTLTGPAGIVFGFSVLVSVLQAVVFAMGSMSDEAEESTSKLEEMGAAAEKMSRQRLNAEIQFTKLQIGLLEEEKKAYNEALKSRLDLAAKSKTGFAGLSTSPTGFSKQEELNQFREYLKKLQDERVTLGDISSIQNRINELQERQAKIKNNPALVRGIQLEIESLQQQLKLLKTPDGVLGIYGQLLEKLKEIEKQKGFAKTTDDLVSLQKQIDSTQSKIDDLETDVMLAVNNWSKEFGELVIKPRVDFIFQPIESDGKVQYYVSKLEKLQPWLSDEAKDARERVMTDMKESLKENADELSNIDRISTLVGNSLYQAFLNGKLSADQLLKSLIAIAAQLAIVEGLKYLFSGGILGIFGRGGNRGGVVGDPYYGGIGIAEGKASGGMIEGNSYVGDRLLVPSNSGELMINKQQQTELFNAISSGAFRSSVQPDYKPTFVFENVIDSQQIYLKGMRDNQSLMR